MACLSSDGVSSCNCQILSRLFFLLVFLSAVNNKSLINYGEGGVGKVGGWGGYEGKKSVTGNYQQKGKWSPVQREIRLIENNLD